MIDAPVLLGERVRLRPWRPDEAARYVALRDDEILRWTTEDPSLTVGGARAAIAAAGDDPSVMPYAIVEPERDEPVGNLPIVLTDRGAVVAYWLAPEARGRGLLADALATVLGWLESDLDVRRFELEVHPDNAASIRAAVRAGFARVGPRASDASCAGDDGTVVVYERLAVGV